MTILIIPDIHCNFAPSIKHIKDNITSADSVVVLGDYVDSFTLPPVEEVVEVFQYLCDIARDNSKVHLLIGNHDMQYIAEYERKWGYTGTAYFRCSGFIEERYKAYHKMFLDNKRLLNIAWEADGWVFSHAGFTKTWVRRYKKQSTDWTGDTVDAINEQFQKCNVANGQTIGCLAFSPLDKGPYGDDVTQGPLWVRPASLLRDMYYDKQVIGHTESRFAPLFYKPSAYSKKRLIMMDSPTHDGYLMLDTTARQQWENASAVGRV